LADIIVEYRAIDNPRGPFVGAAELLQTLNYQVTPLLDRFSIKGY
jgi:hypothetical protein